MKEGNKYGRLTVMSLKGSKVECYCECGEVKTYYKQDVLRGKSRSCGCLRVETMTRHGMHKSRIYSIWSNMKSRCDHKSYPSFDRYGGRGITYDEAWANFDGFKEDMYESYLQHVERHGEEQTSIDRINNDGNYSKENTRWATRGEQVNNRRMNKNNTSGYIGVGWSTQKNKWRSRITRGGIEINIGFFDTPLEAHEAREAFIKTKETIV